MERISVASTVFSQTMDEGGDNISADVPGFMWQRDILHPVEIAARHIKENLHVKCLQITF
jgi:hypothetical protein